MVFVCRSGCATAQTRRATQRGVHHTKIQTPTQRPYNNVKLTHCNGNKHVHIAKRKKTHTLLKHMFKSEYVTTNNIKVQ